MQLDEAIDRNTELEGELIREGRLEKAKSVRLGVEALKLIIRYRTFVAVDAVRLLPGETKD